MKIKVKVHDISYEVEVGDLASRPILATIEGETFEVWPEEEKAAPVLVAAAPVVAAPPPASAPRPAATAPAAVSTSGGALITAPLPGVVDSINVAVGDAVKQGQVVLILEAMKMKNALNAPRAGKVLAIHVATGNQVKHGQALLEIGD